MPIWGRRLASIEGALFLVCATASPSGAQMMLPGANNGVAVDRPPREAGGSAEAVLHPIIVKPPSDATIVGHTLHLDGHAGKMTIERRGPDLVVTRLELTGDKISKPQEACSVEVDLSTPIVALPGGHPHGLTRYDVPLEACPFSFDVLEGSALVSRPEPSCDFTAADCRVTPGGLWGPTPFELPPSRAAELERQRVHVETTMRTNFRVLLRKLSKDKPAAKNLLRDQAAFSSQREMTCRDYEQEPVHGFCSTQITQARVLELLAQFGSPEDEHAAVRGKTADSPKPTLPASSATTKSTGEPPAIPTPARPAANDAPSKGVAAHPSPAPSPGMGPPPLRLNDLADPGPAERPLPPIH